MNFDKNLKFEAASSRSTRACQNDQGHPARSSETWRDSLAKRDYFHLASFGCQRGTCQQTQW
jgi:hypothetical protein